MSESSDKRSAEFLKISSQFKLGGLLTESSHPVTAQLSDVAARDVREALRLLFRVDEDVVKTYEQFARSGRAEAIAQEVLRVIRGGGRMFFTGCGSTGRLSILLVSMWRDFWRSRSPANPSAAEFENRALSVMAGGDFALIKSVEGFEDFADFGRKQIADLGVSKRDVVFAITEGGETSFVIGTAWKGLEAGARVYFVYNNPDDVLGAQVERSREIIDEPGIEKINLTTGPMAISGSTRMQATTIQLCVLSAVLEMVVRELCGLNSTGVPRQFLAALAGMHRALCAPETLLELAALVALEESVYRSGGKINYYAGQFGIDVLTDTTERSPTFCTPPYRKFDDSTAAESWSFLFLPGPDTAAAWRHILKREPNCVEWTEPELRKMVPADKLPRTVETTRKISRTELMRFKIGAEGLVYRPIKRGDGAIAILSPIEAQQLASSTDFFRMQLEAARQLGARAGAVVLGPDPAGPGLGILRELAGGGAAVVPTPATDFLLDGVRRAGLKMLLNALSTCTMVRLGRVMGNFMIWVVPSNLKLIDRATRYISKLTGLSYEEANRILFEVIEYVEPRMKTDQSYPPVVGLAVTRIRQNLGNEEAEKQMSRLTRAH